MEKVYVAVYDTTTGQIRQIVYILEEEVENQHAAWEGCLYVIVPADTTPRDHMIDLATLEPITRVAPPEEVAAKLVRDNRFAVHDTIVGGFLSSALGEERSYPSTPLDQTNMLHASVVGGLLMCALDDDWTLEEHTPEQARQVLTDFVAMRDAARATLLS